MSVFIFIDKDGIPHVFKIDDVIAQPSGLNYKRIRLESQTRMAALFLSCRDGYRIHDWSGDYLYIFNFLEL